MSISDELEKLDRLRREGTLSESEFELAKRKVLEGPQTAESDQLEEIKSQNELAQLDREWELEREDYMVTGRYGNRHIPKQSTSLLSGIVIVVFGIFWTSMASTITGFGAPGAFSFFPMFGVLFIVVGVIVSISSFFTARQYNEAQRRYKRRRRELTKRMRRR